MHEPGTARTGAGGDIAGIQEQDGKAPDSRFAGDGSPLDACSDDDQVVGRLVQLSRVGAQRVRL
jgi:hypothetical protein